MDPHILNFYEDMSLKVSDVYSLIDFVVHGQVPVMYEKLDGQNFTFTVNAKKQLKFMGKGCPKWIRGNGGLDREALHDLYKDKENVAAVFLAAFDSLQELIHIAPNDMISDLFQDGKNVVSSEIVSTINPNVVKYKINAICLIGVQALGSKIEHTYKDLLQPFIDFCEKTKTLNGWIVSSTPGVKFNKPDDADTVAKQLKEKFRVLVPDGCTTMGDILTTYVADRLKDHVSLPNYALQRAARRLVYEQSSIMPMIEFGSNTWKSFKTIEDERSLYLGEWTLPIELFFRELGSYVIENCEFRYADVNDEAAISTMQQRISDIKQALAKGAVSAPNKKVLDRIHAAANRIDETQFTRNVEGVVFTWKGQLRKLTGAFTAINRLNGYFTFGDKALITE